MNGYQKGQCFYCSRKILIETGFLTLAMLITSFPILKRMGARNIDQIWNLVLSCKNCNRGEDGKFEKVPDVNFLKLLDKRNNYYVESPHPLRETILNQTGFLGLKEEISYKTCKELHNNEI